MIIAYDNSRDYSIGQSGDLFWHIMYYAQLNLLYIYPRFFHWLQKVIRDMQFVGNRIIFATYKEQTNAMTGYMILKTDEQEHKICTLQVFPEYRKQGYADELLQMALKLLTKPLITISDAQMDRYSGLLSRYNFALVESINGLYAKDATEHIFRRSDK